MAKPICLVTVDTSRINPSVTLESVQKFIESKLEDYSVLTIPGECKDGEVFKMQVFYEKDFTEESYQGLRKIIEDKLKNLEDEAERKEKGQDKTQY